MKRTIFLFFLFLLFVNVNFLNAQNKKADPFIKQISFKDGNIFLNKKEAYHYISTDNDFLIKDLKDNDVIKGSISYLGDNKFSNIITFVASNKQFYSEKIIGRNQLFFALCKDNIINESFEIDESKLGQFIEENNESK